MMVLDSSAILAFLKGEDGGDGVAPHLENGVVSAANWSEVAQKVMAHGGDWASARAVLVSFGLSIEPTTAADAERAASLWERGSGLSLGDRLCLALAERLATEVLTADRAWGESDRIIQLR